MIHDTIKQRLRGSLLASTSGKTTLEIAARHASELSDEGDWPDSVSERAPSETHLERVLLLAKARHLAPTELDGPVRRAFDWWLSRDARPTDPHRDQFAVPRQIGEIALLCEEELSLGAWGKVTEILTRSRWAYWDPADGWREWKDAPLLAVAYNVILRGCLEKAPALCETAFRRAFKFSRWKQPDEEEPNLSLEPATGSSGLDGLSLAQDYARLLALAHGTSWQAPAEAVRSFVGYLLDYLQWTTRWNVDGSNGFDHVSFGPSPLHGLGAAILHFSQLGNPPRRDELLAYAERLQGRGKPLTGHRSFWRSRVAFHQRPSFSSALRLKTSRHPRQDFGPTSAPPVGSTVYFLRTGEEYADMQQRWNPRQLPGLTAVQRETAGLDPSRGAPRLLGCVSDGEFGLGAYQEDSHQLQARKAWFFFEESVVCLDAGVQGAPSNQPVFTTVNQCRFVGAAFAENVARERFSLSPGENQDLTGFRRVEHGGFLYYFPAPLRLVARIASPAGEYAAPLSAESTFSLCIDHGLKPAGTNAAYAVLPLDQDARARDRSDAEIARLEFLSNTSAVQAVGHRGTGLIGAVFWEPGVVALPRGGRLAANRPCLLLCREHPSGGTILSISNLLTQPAIVHVEYGGTCLSFALPGGADAGRSLGRQL